MCRTSFVCSCAVLMPHQRGNRLKGIKESTQAPCHHLHHVLLYPDHLERDSTGKS